MVVYYAGDAKLYIDINIDIDSTIHGVRTIDSTVESCGFLDCILQVILCYYFLCTGAFCIYMLESGHQDKKRSTLISNNKCLT